MRICDLLVVIGVERRRLFFHSRTAQPTRESFCGEFSQDLLRIRKEVFVFKWPTRGTSRVSDSFGKCRWIGPIEIPYFPKKPRNDRTRESKNRLSKATRKSKRTFGEHSAKSESSIAPRKRKRETAASLLVRQTRERRATVTSDRQVRRSGATVRGDGQERSSRRSPRSVRTQWSDLIPAPHIVMSVSGVRP